MGLKSLATVHKHITTSKRRVAGRVQTAAAPLTSPPGTRTAQRLSLWGAAPRFPLKQCRRGSISLHDVVGNRDAFALEVRGDSMRDEHSISGDYVGGAHAHARKAESWLGS